ncbi:Protein BIG GRAIN 1-like D [Hirschfeldia incana]|nr:Protein BIG GRAIN 1-like D [Hirschfeldia incana]
MHRSKGQSRNPSFSSTLLDEIYNSIDHNTHKAQPFVGSVKKQSISATRSVPDRKIHQDRFFGSASSSSDSNSSIFSSSDTEITHGKKITSSRPLCFGPIKTKQSKTEDEALFHQNRATRVSHDYASNVPKRTASSQKKNPRTPASPGVRIVNFINALFSKQSTAVKSYPRKTSYDDSAFTRRTNDCYPSTTCSSASSFSRSCLNKRSDKTSDCVKRNVRFSPVNVIVPESRSYVEEEGYLRKAVKKNVEDGGRRSVEEIAREFLRDYHKKYENGLVRDNDLEEYEDEDDDDVASDSSSDLFELDLVGTHHHHNLYEDELPVYETTFAGLIL